MNKILCFLGLHKWDGLVEVTEEGHTYPAPKCTRCGKWHHRDMFNVDEFDVKTPEPIEEAPVH